MKGFYFNIFSVFTSELNADVFGVSVIRNCELENLDLSIHNNRAPRFFSTMKDAMEYRDIAHALCVVDMIFKQHLLEPERASQDELDAIFYETSYAQITRERFDMCVEYLKNHRYSLEEFADVIEEAYHAGI